MLRLQDLCYGIENEVILKSTCEDEYEDIEGVRICGQADVMPDSHIAYVGTPDDAQRLLEQWDESSCLNLVVAGCEDADMFERRPLLNLVTSHLPFVQLFNKLIGNFDLYHKLQDKLGSLRVGPDSLDRFVTKALSIMGPGVSIYVFDSDFHLINAHLLDDDTHRPMHDNKSTALQERFFLNHIAADAGTNLQTKPLQAKDTLLGYMTIETEQDQRVPDGFVDLLGKLVIGHLPDSRKLAYSEEAKVSQLLSDIFSLNRKDEDALNVRLHNLPYKLGEFTRLLIISTITGATLMKPDFMRELRKIFPGCNIGFYDEFVVVLLAEKPGFLHHYEFDEQAFNDLLGKYDARAVFSRVGRTIFSLRTIYLQSRDIFNMMLPEEYMKGNKFVFFGDVSDFYRAFLCSSAMSYHNGHDMLLYLTHPIISQVIKYDRENNGNLFDVLVNYLENDCNVAKTADVMHFHRNTIINKVNKIRDVFKIDFTDCKLKMDLYASCQIARYAMHMNNVNTSRAAFLYPDSVSLTSDMFLDSIS